MGSLRRARRERTHETPAGGAGVVLTPGTGGRLLKTAAVYYRVSTGRQDLDSQKHEVEKFIAELPVERRFHKVVVYKDEGLSGRNDNRPGFLAMLADARAGKVSTIVVYKLDRFSRSATGSIRLLLELDAAGVAFVSTSQPVLNLGHENPFRRTMLAAFAEISEIERETIVNRVRAGLAAAVKRGRKLGAPKKICPEQQRTARLLKSQGMSYKVVAKQLSLSVGTVFKLIKGPEL